MGGGESNNVVRALRGMQLCGYKIKPGANSKNMGKVEHILFRKRPPTRSTFTIVSRSIYGQKG